MLKYGLVTLMLLANSCNKSENIVRTPGEELQMQELMLSLESFQWELFQQVVASENTNKNLNISPLSIAAALYMTYEGAASDTREKMALTLKLPTAQADFNLGEAYEDLMVELEKPGAILSTSNAIFWDKNRMDPKDEFLTYVRDYFDAGQFDLEFQDASALKAINDWVKSSTQNRIDKIIDQISSEEVLFLINALYFKADWRYPFPKESSREAEFVRGDGAKVEADMMFQDISTLKYYQGNDFAAVEMPFADTVYSMVLLLPPDQSSPDQLVASLNPSRLTTLFDQDLQVGRIYLNVPRFEIEYKIILNDVLKSLGMELAFDPNEANFSNLGRAPEGNLFISKVNHKTYLKVDEKGAEGAAVTSVGVGVTSAPPALNFDRPYVFLLRNRSSNTLIFAGKMEDPSQN